MADRDDQVNLDDLLAEARDAARKTEAARQDMLTHARRRQQAVLAAHRHLSVRQLAVELGCSPTVVQGVLRAARLSIN